MNNFKTMLSMMWDLQSSIITVEGLEEEFYDKWAITNHIIIPDGLNKVTDFMFIQCRCNIGEEPHYFLANVTSLDMGFKDAIVHFSNKTMRSQGAVLTLHAN